MFHLFIVQCEHGLHNKTQSDMFSGPVAHPVYTVGCHNHNYWSFMETPIQIVLNQEFCFDHNFASTQPIYKIQKGTDK